MSVVGLDMDTQTSTQMTIKEAAAHLKVSDKTVRRWIQQKKVNAEQVDGRWHVHVDLDTDQPNVQPDVQPDDQVERMQSEIQHLRDALAATHRLISRTGYWRC